MKGVLTQGDQVVEDDSYDDNDYDVIDRELFDNIVDGVGFGRPVREHVSHVENIRRPQETVNDQDDAHQGESQLGDEYLKP